MLKLAFQRLSPKFSLATFAVVIGIVIVFKSTRNYLFDGSFSRAWVWFLYSFASRVMIIRDWTLKQKYYAGRRGQVSCKDKVIKTSQKWKSFQVKSKMKSLLILLSVLLGKTLAQTNCFLPGHCEAVYNSITVVPDEFQCLKYCKGTSDCNFFSWYSDGICFSYPECPSLNQVRHEEI